MSDNLKDAKECGATVEDVIYPEGTVQRVTFHTNSAFENYTSRILASQQAAHEAEIAKLKEENELYRAEMSGAKEAGWYSAEELFSAYKTTDAKLSTANERIAYIEGLVALQADALNTLKDNYKFNDKRPPKFLLRAISASAETVQAFRDKLTEPLRREVAMLRDRAANMVNSSPSEELAAVRSLRTALEHTQATAQAYEQEVEARGAIKALEDAAKHCGSVGDAMTRKHNFAQGSILAHSLRVDFERQATQLRATSKKG